MNSEIEKSRRVSLSNELADYLRSFCADKYMSPRQIGHKGIFNVVMEVLAKNAILKKAALKNGSLEAKFSSPAGAKNLKLNKDVHDTLRDLGKQLGLPDDSFDTELQRSVICNALFRWASTDVELGVDGINFQVYQHLRDRHKRHSQQFYFLLKVEHRDAFNLAKQESRVTVSILRYLGDFLTKIREMPETDFTALMKKITELSREFERDKLGPCCFVNVVASPESKKRIMERSLPATTLDTVFTTAAVIRMREDGLLK